MQAVKERFHDREFWIKENQQYARPNFRLRKCARLISELAGDGPCDLLDLGCGPAALRSLAGPNVKYHGLDIAPHFVAPDVRELDFIQNPIGFDGKRFDIVVALGVFEYMGPHQLQKFKEVSSVLKPNGKFILSYINFRHYLRRVYPIYNNIQSIDELTASLQQVFEVERCFPVSHHWRHKQPGPNALPAIQMRINRTIPLISSRLAVEYFCLCSRRG